MSILIRQVVSRHWIRITVVDVVAGLRVLKHTAYTYHPIFIVHLATYVVCMDVRMRMFQAIVQDGHYDISARHAQLPCFFHIVIESGSSILKQEDPLKYASFYGCPTLFVCGSLQYACFNIKKLDKQHQLRMLALAQLFSQLNGASVSNLFGLFSTPALNLKYAFCAWL